MPNAILIHGLNGNPNEHWFPWLKKELEKRGYNVYIPELPINEKHAFKEWEAAFSEYRKYLDQDSIIVGHSVGATFALHILEKKVRPIRGAFLLAGFTSELGNKEIDELNKSFTEKEFDFETIKKKAKEFFVYASDNDPYVPLEKTQELADKLGEEAIIVEDAGHFNTASGYTEFEDLLIDIISVEHIE